LAEGNWEKYGRHTIPITSTKNNNLSCSFNFFSCDRPHRLGKMSSNQFRFSVSIESNPKEIYNSKERRECQRIKGRIKNAQFNSSFKRKGRNKNSQTFEEIIHRRRCRRSNYLWFINIPKWRCVTRSNREDVRSDTQNLNPTTNVVLWAVT
jgi:hypothetical protein